MIDRGIPDLEIDLLTNTVEEALSFAHEGNAARGYLELMYGLQRAREGVTEGEWGPALVLRWHGACRRFAAEWLGGN